MTFRFRHRLRAARPVAVWAGQSLLLSALLVLASGSLCRRQGADLQIENISNNASSDRPCIACTSEGHVALAWSDYSTGHEEVWLVEKDKGGTWSTPYNLSRAGNINGSRGVSLCYGRDGTLHAAWSQFAPRGQTGAWTIACTRRPPGGDWAVPETIWHGTAVIPHIGVDTSGMVHLEFEDMTGGSSTICYASRTANGEWSPVQEVSAPDAATSGGLGVYDDGSAVAVWERWEEGPGEFGSLLWSERTLAGAWTPPALVDFPARYCLGPTTRGNGSEVALAFTASDTRRWLVVMTRPRHAQWSEPDTSFAGSYYGKPAVAVASDGAVILAWDAFSEPALRVARRDSSWLQLRVSDSLYPNRTTVAVDGSGCVYLAWSSQPNYPEPPDIYYTEIDAGEFQK